MRHALAVALVFVAGGVARADDLDAYRQHYQRGRDAVRANDLRGAAAEFEAAYAASPGCDAVFDLGVVYRHLAQDGKSGDDARRAIDAFQRYLACYRLVQGADAPDASAVARWLEELRPLAPPAPFAPPPLPPRPGQAWEPPPVSLNGVPLPAQPRTASALPVAAPPEAMGLPASSGVQEDNGQKNTAALFCAIGLAGLIGSAVAAGFGAADNASIRSGGVANLNDLQGKFSDGQTWNTLAVVSGIVGGLGAGIGVVLYLTAPSRPSVSLSVSPGPGGAFAKLSVGIP